MRTQICVMVMAIVVITWLWWARVYRYRELKCIVSSVNGETYCVRDRARLSEAADLLARVAEKCKALVAFVGTKYADDEDVQRLVRRFDPRVICETLPTSEHTAYTENKGDAIAFCLNSDKKGMALIDLNTLTFVAIHELSHVMTLSEGHKQEFWENFKFLLQNAVEANIYQPVDYKKKPVDFCGMAITDNPLQT